MEGLKKASTRRPITVSTFQQTERNTIIDIW
jgi:hypothetical protein